MIAHRYHQEMLANAQFPPILVSKLDDHLILVDGAHRLKAMGMKGEKYIKAIVLEGLNRNQIYIEAIRANNTHGAQFTPYDKARIIQKLEDMRLSIEDISKLSMVPLTKIETFIAKRLTNTATGEEIVLKKPLRKRFAGTTISEEQSDEINEEQSAYEGIGTRQLINQLTSLFEMGAVQIEDKKTLNNLRLLYGHIGRLLEGRKGA